VSPELVSPDVWAHSVESHLNPDQIVRQKYGPQVSMSRGIVHSSRTLANRQGIKENMNAISHRQNQGFVRQKETMSKEPETQDHE
jgi:hypothetical protein